MTMFPSLCDSPCEDAAIHVYTKERDMKRRRWIVMDKVVGALVCRQQQGMSLMRNIWMMEQEQEWENVRERVMGEIEVKQEEEWGMRG